MSRPSHPPRRPSVGLALALVAAACTAGAPSTDGGDAATGLQGVDRIAAYLRSDPAPGVVIEVDDATGGTLSEEVWNTFLADVQALVDAPDGVAITTTPLDEAGRAWSRTALRDLADATADAEPTGRIHLHVMVLPGAHEEGAAVLGAAWDHHHIAVFADAVDEACRDDAPTTWSPTRLQRVCDVTATGLLLHELGHILGLVDDGTPMVVDHEDPEHPHHDLRPGCAMYWAYDGVGLAEELHGREDPTDRPGLCDESLADLAAVREGRAEPVSSTDRARPVDTATP